MKGISFLLLFCAFFSLACMEEGDEEITVVAEKEDLRELEFDMVQYVENIKTLFTPIYARTAIVEDFTRNPYNHAWKDLEILSRAVKNRNYYKVRKKLKNYRIQTLHQLRSFARGLTLLNENNEASEEFKQNIKKLLRPDHHKYFDKNFCKNKVTPNEWLQLRICALELLQQKLLEKTWKERALATLEKTPTCIEGTACGISLMTITSPYYWPLGAIGIMLSGCLCLGCPDETYDDCKPSNACSNTNDIAYLLQNAIRFSHLDESKVLSTLSSKKKEYNERDALLPKIQSPKGQKPIKPVKGNDSLNNKFISVNT